ncbi:hypothetical protein CP8484711_1966B, partial [Chlamydia psittaci 84-8471/1]
HAFLPKTY